MRSLLFAWNGIIEHLQINFDKSIEINEVKN